VLGDDNCAHCVPSLSGLAADPIADAAAKIYRRNVTDGPRDDEVEDWVDVRRYVTMIAARLNEQFEAVSAKMQSAVEEHIPELGGDPRIVELMSAGVRGNLKSILEALLHGVPAEGITPAEAIEHARFVAQQGVPVNAIVRSYRFAQRRMTDLVFAELHALDMDPTIKVAVIEAITTRLFEYVDRVSQQAVAAYEREHERWLVNQNSIRAMKVRDILADGTPEDVDAAATAIGYPLGWQHLALIVWYPEAAQGSDELARLQRFASALATAVDTSAKPLFVAADQTTGWAWLPYRSAPGDVVTQVRDFARLRTEAPNIAIGAVGFGVGGFRRSHRQAQRARDAARARSLKSRVVVAATDAGMLASAVLGGSFEELRGWVADVLGPLASDTDDDAVLRETLRVFLHSASGYQSAAKELGVELSSVKHRVQQAVSRRGRPLDDRVEVELALLVCHWYGAAVLRQT
jgi:DNA-binding PucR family transcriptional regulator